MDRKFVGGLPLAELFTVDRCFLVPEYQRDYAWRREDAELLYNDLSDFKDGFDQAGANGSSSAGHLPYFLGTIVLMIENDTDCERRAPMEIIDGQQRLITLQILLACLRDLEDDAEEKARLLGMIVCGADYRLQAKSVTQAFLVANAFEPEATRRPLPEMIETASLRHLGEVRDAFRGLLRDLPVAERRDFADFVLHHGYVAAVISSDCDRAYQIFSRINRRGQPLLRSDILKAEIIGSIAPGQRAQAVAEWNRLQGELGDDFDGVAKRNYLFNYVKDFYGPSSLGVITGIRRLVAEHSAETFMANMLKPVGVAYQTVIKAAYDGGTDEQNTEIRRYLTYLNRYSWTEWRAPAIVWLMHHRDKPERIVTFLRQLDRYAMAMTLLETRNGEGRKERKSRLEKITIELLKKPDGRSPEELFVVNQDTRLLRNQLQFCLQSKVAKMVLLRLCELIDGLPFDRASQITRGYNVEHVLPDNPRAASDWAKFDNGGQYAKKLGNFYLVTISLNTELSNQNWSPTKRLPGKKKLFHVNAAEILGPDPAYLLQADAWDEKTIDIRHKRLLEIAVDHWDFR